MYRRDVIITFLVVMLATAALQSYGDKRQDDNYRRFETLATVVQKIKENYVTKVSEKEVFEGALRGVVMNLDRYSAYISPEDFQDFHAKTSGEFQGLGIEIGVRGGWLTVIAPIENTPASRAGMLAGDRIIKIETESTKDMTIMDAVKRLRGKKGTKVTITIVHAGSVKEIELTITRGVIPLISVRGYKRLDKNGKWDFFADSDAKVGYIRVGAFQENTMKEFDEATAKLQADGMKALILDLRFNPGGQLSVAIDMCNRFLSEGVIVSTKGRVGPADIYRAEKKHTLPDFPVAVLVNNWSASASEIVAGALQDHRRAIIVGEHTFGKGSVQTVFQLEEGTSALKLTTAHYYTPSGRGIHRDETNGEGGLKPDIDIPTTLKDEAGLQKHWYSLSSPKRDDKPEETPQKKEQDEGEDEDKDKDEEKDEDQPKSEDDPFVDIQLQRALDALKVLEMFGTDRK